MKKLIALVMAFVIVCWAVPKPMESVENYNILMVHGAYGSDQGNGFDLSVCDSLPYKWSGTVFL
ncbi:MAG: hypothetical protein SPL52_15230 [Fibrobacter sp.]|nr:hypothetical protein [Fibrobacter sp.]